MQRVSRFTASHYPIHPPETQPKTERPRGNGARSAFTRCTRDPRSNWLWGSGGQKGEVPGTEVVWEPSRLVTQKPRPDSGEQCGEPLSGLDQFLRSCARWLQHFHPESLIPREMYGLDFSKCYQNPWTRKSTRDLCQSICKTRAALEVQTVCCLQGHKSSALALVIGYRLCLRAGAAAPYHSLRPTSQEPQAPCTTLDTQTPSGRRERKCSRVV